MGEEMSEGRSRETSNERRVSWERGGFFPHHFTFHRFPLCSNRFHVASVPPSYRLPLLVTLGYTSRFSAEPVPTEGGTRRVNGESETRPDRRRER